ncbi:MAG: thiol-disulfide oxidoreductase DCC family protein [Flavobacteriales bacterium]
MTQLPGRLIVFDGVCVLCNRFTHYVIKRDPLGKFFFTSYQNLQEKANGLALALPQNLDQSIAYYCDKKFYQGSTAILLIFKDLHGRFHWSQLGWLVPRLIRDFFYFRVAAKRYQWFGQLPECHVPSKDIKDRFL